MIVDYTKALESAKNIELQYARFKAVVGISVEDALSFYCATGDLPTYEQTRFIATHGIKAVMEAIYANNTKGGPKV